ncbi:MAG: Asp-tRNA(Asn)/Glu-tRNA(Gln) amidotransferase subunit GatC [Clostridiales bacterium]|nr:Asp-tRNA(Asn)/Glu-tRNA(Gln) amidotransferase subunit GatC [Clostridiales bacterium]
MTLGYLISLEQINQLSLTDRQREEIIAFFAARDAELERLYRFDTADTERMVHVMPIMTVVREDKAVQLFTREALQAAAPETDEGYWCVPRVLE